MLANLNLRNDFETMLVHQLPVFSTFVQDLLLALDCVVAGVLLYYVLVRVHVVLVPPDARAFNRWQRYVAVLLFKSTDIHRTSLVQARSGHFVFEVKRILLSNFARLVQRRWLVVGFLANHCHLLHADSTRREYFRDFVLAYRNGRF
jgi:hypothetical protein